jgi:hypothetical protein
MKINLQEAKRETGVTRKLYKNYREYRVRVHSRVHRVKS